ncbi:MAG: hypothetical protein WDZ26_05445 [Nitriliruptoraceae bacterium]
MSLLEHPSSVRSFLSPLDELEDAFRAWAHGTDKPDTVDLGHRQIPMVELSRRLANSQTTLDRTACIQIGVPDGATMAAATAELLHATIDPDGPRCRSFRAASWYLRGLPSFDVDLAAVTRPLRNRGERSRGLSDVR